MNSSPEPVTGEAETWLEGQLRERRRLVDSALERWLPTEDERPPELHAAMRYAVLGEGKRLRPVLVLAAAEACGGEADQALRAAAAVEFVHCYSLVHDDLPAIDDDDLRRGRPTCHKVFGEAMAVLAGDALLTLAFEVLTKQVEDERLAAVLVFELARAAGHAGMVGGQVVDILSEGEEPSSELLDYIHRHKTGALIRASVRMGSLCAGASEERLRALTAYGERVGLAFQIADDCLDVTSSAKELGKATQKDLERGKLTYPGLVGLEEARAVARRLVEEAVVWLQDFGAEARLLEQLARFIIRRRR
ncbi:MAG: polyprenyl synthetase family protein [Planctomycetes bacterium]|nr:polyprenyl synthetase family protein [Planctomycetota bacterium]